MYRPIYKEFKKWPEIYYTTKRGHCPFASPKENLNLKKNEDKESGGQQQPSTPEKRARFVMDSEVQGSSTGM